MPAKNEHGLTPQQEIFAHEVAKGNSLSDAYRAAYKVGNSKPQTVNENASRVMSDPKVSARVAALQNAAADQAELVAADVIREIRRVCFSDIAGIMDKRGRVKLPHELDPATRAAVASFKIDEYGRLEYKFWDKNSALEKAAKIRGLYKEDNGQKDKGAVEFLAKLNNKIFGVQKDDDSESDGDGVERA